MNTTTRSLSLIFTSLIVILTIPSFYCGVLHSKPNILFLVADDLGWNDVSWHNKDMITPNLQQLANEGVILNQSYVLPMCSPSRAAFLTGQYPFKYGLQNFVFGPVEPKGLPLSKTTLGQHLQLLGYKTHLIGKWHLGYCSPSYTPTNRGFDSFFGFYTGLNYHFTHSRPVEYNGTTYIGLNLYANETLQLQYNGTYATDLYTQKAIEVIKNEKDNPFILIYSIPIPHHPLEVPQKYLDMYPNEQNEARRIYSAMVTAMDEGFGRVIEALKSSGQYENTLIVFTSDNGGEDLYGGNNWPLRGAKETIWEGGTRAVGFVHASFLKIKGYTSNKLIHIVDWFATFLKFAGGEPDPGIDGVDQWSMLNEDGPSERKEIIYNIDNTTSYGAAIRYEDYKLIIGDAGGLDLWYIPENVIDALDNRDEIVEVWKEHNRTQSDWIQLYNLKTDPHETTNIASQHPEIVNSLLQRLEEQEKHYIPNIHLPLDPDGLPHKWNETFSSGWCLPQ